MNYRTRLRNVREDHDETQAAIGRILSKSQQGYNHIENGRAELSIEDLEVLCRHYDLSADYLTGLSDVPRSFEEKKPAADISVRCVSAYLSIMAAKSPGKTAYVDPKRSITFEELRQETMHVAQTLANSGLRKAPVAIFMNKSVDLLSVIHGIAMSGNFYTILDTETPGARLQKILDVFSPVLIITTEDLAAQVQELRTKVPVMLFSSMIRTPVEEPRLRAIERRIRPSDPLFVIFASNENGRPKGTIATQGALLQYISCWEEIFGLTPDDVMLSQVPFFFVMSLMDIFAPIVFGTEMHIVPREYFYFPIMLMEYMERNRVTTLNWASSTLTLIARMNAFTPEGLSSVRNIFFGGETLRIQILKIWQAHAPQAVFLNGYGTTETLDGATGYRINRPFEDGEVLPIGRPFPHMNVFLLNDSDEEILTPGIPGEICCSGPSVSLGYYNDLEATAAAFSQNPLNPYYEEKIFRTGDYGRYNEYGELEFLGRKDDQVKFMGHRIELGEIEAASWTDGVVDVACFFDEATTQIILCYTGTITPSQLGDFLKMQLPDYMLPRRRYKVSHIPRNPDGMPDRAALAEQVLGMKS